MPAKEMETSTRRKGKINKKTREKKKEHLLGGDGRLVGAQLLQGSHSRQTVQHHRIPFVHAIKARPLTWRGGNRLTTLFLLLLLRFLMQ